MSLAGCESGQVEINVSYDMRQLTKGLRNVERQIPFATALALTKTAQKVAEAEKASWTKEIDKPTPFTLAGIGVKAAKKTNLTASVFVKDKQARYLKPMLDGGLQVVTKKAVLIAVNTGNNAYGNIPKGKLAALKGRKDVFVGLVKFKSGKEIYGVWQRGERGRRRHGHYVTKGRVYDIGGDKTTLKLLIELFNPRPVTKRLDWRERAKSVVAKELPRQFEAALNEAIATAK
jgi:hypothetical protein